MVFENLLVIVLMIMLSMLSHSLKPTPSLFRSRIRWSKRLCSARSTNLFSGANGALHHTDLLEDNMITCLNGAQDISVKVISCANLVQKSIDRLSMTQQVAQGYGELLTGAILMSSNMKGEEVLQINLVGGIGAQNMMVVVDSQLRAKGKVGNANFAIGNGVDKLNTAELIGPGQLQVIKNHPFWKQPVNGIVAIRDVPISINLALYMTESEQRLSAIISDIKIENGECKYAVGIMVERLPGATDANVETSIKNLETVAKKGISAYLSTGSDRFTNGEELHKVVDDCVFEMEKGSIRWERKPTFHCSCGLDRVWGALKLLPGSEITDIVESGKGVEMKCEFCGQMYNLSSEEVAKEMSESRKEE